MSYALKLRATSYELRPVGINALSCSCCIADISLPARIGIRVSIRVMIRVRVSIRVRIRFRASQIYEIGQLWQEGSFRW